MGEELKPKEVRRDSLPWSEITGPERIERLREVAKRTKAECAELRRMLWELRETITQHEHGVNGKPMVSADRLGRPNLTDGVEQCAPGKEWF